MVGDGEEIGGNYAAYVPDLPGCSAVGDTVEDTKRNIRDVIALHLKHLRDQRMPVPSPSTVVEYVEVEIA